jgi:hypothetical protein
MPRAARPAGFQVPAGITSVSAATALARARDRRPGMCPGGRRTAGCLARVAAAESAVVAVGCAAGELDNGLAGGRRRLSPDGSQMPALGERSLRGMGAEWYFVPAIMPWAGRGVMG